MGDRLGILGAVSTKSFFLFRFSSRPQCNCVALLRKRFTQNNIWFGEIYIFEKNPQNFPKFQTSHDKIVCFRLELCACTVYDSIFEARLQLTATSR